MRLSFLRQATAAGLPGKSLDQRTDLYPVRVMLDECATGDVPFVGHVMPVMDQHICDAPMAPGTRTPRSGRP
jgi:hypothetical protein